ncbi:MAG: CDP-diacylglycerol--serine O-phosphatidyltransferase [Myxococcota bacterium]|jgi:CDP-diacylglycerol--serine O-phosphatidyltransferase
MLIVLPTAFTLTSILFGLLAVVWAPTQPAWAAVAIIFAALCDGLDGRVARLTHTESELGMQLDSLADAVSFGVAPATLIYHWALTDVWGGLAVAMIYLACGVLRLARFNVEAMRPDAPKNFKGMPIPAAAGVLVGVVLAGHDVGAAALSRAAFVAPITLMLAVLMVSGIEFRSFKRFRSARTTVAFAGAVLVGLGVLVAFTTVGVMLLTVATLYVASGIVPALMRLPGRVRR